MLEVLILGTAAGGGLPQWNCACENCQLSRAGKLAPRSQSSLAISANGRDWHLVNASPDVARQLERLPFPASSSGAARVERIRTLFLTNADLDHCLGLLQLREGAALNVTAPEAVRASLERGLRMSAVLGAFGGISWRPASAEWTPVDGSGLEARAVSLATDAPRYDADSAVEDLHAVGYLFRSGTVTIGVFPDVAHLDAALLQTIEACDYVWIDGTFWANDELAAVTGRTAAQMGHLPIEESLPLLRPLAGRCAYLHINNTNPVLRPDASQRRAVEAAGLRIAEDGDRHVF